MTDFSVIARARAAEPSAGSDAVRTPKRRRFKRRDVRKRMGRPTKYVRKYVAMMDEYFDVEPIERIVCRDGMVRHVYRNFPTFERFALSIGVIPDTLLGWAAAVEADGRTLKHPEFAEAYERARARQSHCIQIGGLSGAYPPVFAALAAKNKVGWADRTETDTSVTHRFDQADEAELNRIYAENSRRAAIKNATRGKGPLAGKVPRDTLGDE